MRIYQCSNNPMSSSIPAVFPHSCPIGCNCSTDTYYTPAILSPHGFPVVPDDPFYPGFNGFYPSNPFSFPPTSGNAPLSSPANLLLNHSTPTPTAASENLPETTIQTDTAPLPTPSAPPDTRSVTADDVILLAKDEVLQKEDFSVSQLDTVIADDVDPAWQSARHLPYPDQTSLGCAVQFSLTNSAAQNADVLPLELKTVSGNEISLTSNGVLFAPGNLYFISFNLKAQTGFGHFGEVIAQINGALRPDFSAFSNAPPFSASQPDESDSANALGLSANFLLNTAADRQPTLLELIFHTSAPDSIPIRGNLIAFKLGAVLPTKDKQS